MRALAPGPRADDCSATEARAPEVVAVLAAGWLESHINGATTRNVVAHETFQFKVGATLHVAASQAEGTYTGTFDVTVLGQDVK